MMFFLIVWYSLHAVVIICQFSGQLLHDSKTVLIGIRYYMWVFFFATCSYILLAALTIHSFPFIFFYLQKLYGVLYSPLK